MNWGAIQNAIASWAATATGLTVRWAGQNAPRPAYPFVVLNIIAEKQLGQDEERYEYNDEDDVLDVNIGGNRGFTVSVQANTLPPPEGTYGADRAAISAARVSLKKQSVITAFRLAGIAIVGAEAAQSISEEVEGRWISRTILDVKFATVENITDSEIDYIDSVQISGTDDVPIIDETFDAGA